MVLFGFACVVVSTGLLETETLFASVLIVVVLLALDLFGSVFVVVSHLFSGGSGSIVSDAENIPQ